ncbi:cell wall metabolism sensor histidine kinase WalK [Paenibacillus sp. FSL H8-0259]|uniref:sensor histidine kinase n=1 Tax=Paenibacillus sp. FSL H8-0259 TaxID=1920423 RepID=UPI002115E951|nr:HAMP domain-containing sensor histidine kinase [Paenibacillus sp. FSL H8-0259]
MMNMRMKLNGQMKKLKLVHQINFAFGLSLLLVLSITGVMIHFVLMDHFIGKEQEGLRTLGATLTASMQQLPAAAISAVPIEENKLFPVQYATLSSGVQAIVTDQQGKVVSGTLPAIPGQAQAVTGIAAVETGSLQSLWDGNDPRYLVQVNALPQGKLTLLTPVSRIKAIEQALLKRLILVFAASAAVMFLFSLFITRKLIDPLISLREELKKVKNRRFADVNLLRAGGEIGSVARTVYEMAGELHRFNRVQKQFFQNASHELKSPLMSISGYAEGIRDGIFEGEDVRRGLDIILGESGRLRDLVGEMTLLAKLDSEEDIFRAVECDLEELLSEAVERINPQLAARKLSLKTVISGDRGLMLRADRDKLLQALLNVLSNAARYADRKIDVHGYVSKGLITLTVSDDGPGIPQELLPSLFHRFVKGKNGDSGLGLAISRAIVERCGGKITARNCPEGGAVLTFEFPSAAG